MKRFFIIGLAFVMLLGSLTACKQEVKPTESKPQTQTDLSTPAVIDQQPKEEAEAVTDASQPIQQEVNESTEQAEEPEETKPVSKVEAKPESKPVSKAEAKPASKPKSKAESQVDKSSAEQKTEQPQLTAEDIHGLKPLDNPTFVSEEAFRVWLNQGSGRYEEDRTLALQQATNQKFVYFRPANDLTVYGKLDSLSYAAGGLCYEYTEETSTDGEIPMQIVVSAYSHNDYHDIYDRAKQSYINGTGRKCMTHNGIDYYYLGDYQVSICWQQFGCTHVASIMYNHAKVEDIIPRLELEQVTIPLNTDLVTQ